MNSQRSWMCTQAQECLAASDRFIQGMHIGSIVLERSHVVALRHLNTLIEHLPRSPLELQRAIAQCQMSVQALIQAHIIGDLGRITNCAYYWNLVNSGFGTLSYALKLMAANINLQTDHIIQRVENMDILDQVLGTVKDLTPEKLKGLKPHPLSADNLHHCQSFSARMRLLVSGIKLARAMSDSVLPHTRRYATDFKQNVIPGVARVIAAARQDGWPGRCAASGIGSFPLGDIDRALQPLTASGAVNLVEQGASYLLDANVMLDEYINHSINRVLAITDDLSLLIFVVELKAVNANWQQIGEYADQLATAFRQ